MAFTAEQTAAIKAAAVKQLLANPSLQSTAQLQKLLGIQGAANAINATSTGADKVKPTDAHAKYAALNAAWLAETDPVQKRNYFLAMQSIAKDVATPDNINGFLQPGDQTTEWLNQRANWINQTQGLDSAEATQDIANEQVKASIMKNARDGMYKSARNSAARGIANSSIRDAALVDIDAGATVARNDIDARLSTMKAQNDIARSNLTNQFLDYDQSLDPVRIKNASPPYVEPAAAPVVTPEAKPVAVGLFDGGVKPVAKGAIGTKSLATGMIGVKHISKPGSGISNAQAKKIAQKNGKK